MWSVIGLVAWGILGLPVVLPLVRSLDKAVAYDQAQPAQSEQEGRPGQNIPQPAADALSVPKTKPDKPGAKEHGSWYQTFLDHPAEWVVAIFTIMLAVYTRGLYKATKGLQTATLGLVGFAEEQAADMKDSIAAAKESVAISKQSLVDTQRAFVFVKSFEQHIIGDKMRMLVQWENSGSTPTKEMRTWANWGPFSLEGMPDDHSFPDLNEEGLPLPVGHECPPTFMGPKSTLFGEMLEIPVSYLEMARTVRGRIFLWGWVEYLDIFEDTPRHRTEFCNEVLVTGMSVEDDGRITVALAYPQHNRHNSAT